MRIELGFADVASSGYWIVVAFTWPAGVEDCDLSFSEFAFFDIPIGDTVALLCYLIEGLISPFIICKGYCSSFFILDF